MIKILLAIGGLVYTQDDVKYRIVMKKTTWKNALRVCRARPGGDLVSLTTAETVAKIRGKMRAKKTGVR